MQLPPWPFLHLPFPRRSSQAHCKLLVSRDTRVPVMGATYSHRQGEVCPGFPALSFPAPDHLGLPGRDAKHMSGSWAFGAGVWIQHRQHSEAKILCFEGDRRPSEGLRGERCRQVPVVALSDRFSALLYIASPVISSLHCRLAKLGRAEGETAGRARPVSMGSAIKKLFGRNKAQLIVT